MVRPNASAAACAWLSGAIRRVAPEVWRAWWRPIDEQFRQAPKLIWNDPWPHDYWIAQGVDYSYGMAIPTWLHNGAIDDWPLLEPSGLPDGIGQVTNTQSLDDLIEAARSLPYRHAEVLATFMSYVNAPREGQPAHWLGVREPVRLKAAAVRAWLDAVLGSSLAGLVLSPTEDHELLTKETRRRVDAAWKLGAYSDQWLVAVNYAVEAFWTASWHELQPTLVPTHQGQPLDAEDHWRWLTRPLSIEHVREAVQVAAGLLVSPAVLDALLAVAGEERTPAPLALCALRRWATGLRAMAWLEEALGQSWVDIRAADLVCFAYAAIAPWWPRQSLGISHRSADAKPLLKTLDLWGTPHVAIDATTVPVWETNTGFVWRLFAATPTVLRVRSPRYDASTWCRREAELMRYLVDRCDFLRGRVFAEADMSELAAIGRAAAGLATPPVPEDSAAFPPLTMVLDVPSPPALIVDLLAGVCTLRLLHALLRDVDLVNRIARDLARGTHLELPAPTNAPDAWRIHYEVFGRLASHAASDDAPLRLAAEYPQLQYEVDLEDIANRIPDMRGIACDGVDVLAALEWNREIRRWFGERWVSDRVVVDCRNLDADAWTSERGHAIKRGMLDLRTNTLVFVVQRADQTVDRWRGIADREAPILTQHVSDQLNWLAHALTAPTWLAAYTSLPDFKFAPELVRAAYGALGDEFAAYKGQLSAPREYADVFMLPVDTPAVRRMQRTLSEANKQPDRE
jgi:hypothetical protein